MKEKIAFVCLDTHVCDKILDLAVNELNISFCSINKLIIEALKEKQLFDVVDTQSDDVIFNVIKNASLSSIVSIGYSDYVRKGVSALFKKHKKVYIRCENTNDIIGSLVFAERDKLLGKISSIIVDEIDISKCVGKCTQIIKENL